MILDAYGKPARRLFGLEFVDKMIEKQAHDWEAERRVANLRNHLDFLASTDDRPFKVGTVINVRIPKRFA